MGIANRDDANKYYAQVSDLVEQYMQKGNIRPSRLGTYMRPDGENFTFFLKAHGLSEVNGIDTVLKDVIEDLVAMEDDGVMTFESFKLMESDEFKITDAKKCLYVGINVAGLSHEKALADEFDTSLGHIESIDPDAHDFRIDDWNGEATAVIYSEEEVEIILENFIDYSFGKAQEMAIEPIPGVKIDLDGMLSENRFVGSMSQKLKREGAFLDILAKMVGKKVHVNKKLSGGKWFIFVG
jgi:hypothetical protein